MSFPCCKSSQCPHNMILTNAQCAIQGEAQRNAADSQIRESKDLKMLQFVLPKIHIRRKDGKHCLTLDRRLLKVKSSHRQINDLYECCNHFYERQGDAAESVSCPKIGLLRLKMKQSLGGQSTGR